MANQAGSGLRRVGHGRFGAWSAVAGRLTVPGGRQNSAVSRSWLTYSALQPRPAEQLGGSDSLSATLAADRAFPAAVAELGRSEQEYRRYLWVR